jgi:hypothetical protein
MNNTIYYSTDQIEFLKSIGVNSNLTKITNNIFILLCSPMCPVTNCQIFYKSLSKCFDSKIKFVKQDKRSDESYNIYVTYKINNL